jgi:hypothetical protein
MKKLVFATMLAISTVISPTLAYSGEKAPVKKAAPILNRLAIAAHLQDVSVTIRSEGGWSAGEGSGVIFSRKDKAGNTVNFVWTAGHVIDNLRSERRVLINGSSRTVVEFKDAKIIKVIRQNGRSVGRLELDAEVIKYSDADDGHDLALLRVRKLNFVKDSATFYLDDRLLPLGTELYHVGSLLGQLGANSMTDGIYSQHGRLIPSLNKRVFDQTTVAAFPGSSGGGVYLKSDGRYVGMIVRGAGETFNLIVPVRRMVEWAKENDLMWALDRNVPLPARGVLNKMAVEDSVYFPGAESRPAGTTKAKGFPFLLRLDKTSLLKNNCDCKVCGPLCGCGCSSKN